MKKIITFFNAVLLPGFVFQNVIMAGGYGTGRELAEYFLILGPKSALCALLVTGLIWATLCVLTFEFARCYKAYEYYTFFKNLLGRAWILFEVVYWLIVLLVLAIIGAASGSIFEATLHWPYGVGVITLMAFIAAVVYFKNRIIGLVLTYWSFFLLLIYITFFIICYMLFSSEIRHTLESSEVVEGWGFKGIKYAIYNLCFMPAVLFSLTRLKTRKEAVIAGLFSGFIAIVPAFFFILAMCSAYPSIVNVTVPAATLISQIGSPVFGIMFYIALFGTLVGTGVGMIHAINQRVQIYFKNKQQQMPNVFRSGIAIICFLLAYGISQFGLVLLIDKGYGSLSWVMAALYVLPLLLVGSYKIFFVKNHVSCV